MEVLFCERHGRHRCDDCPVCKTVFRPPKGNPVDRRENCWRPFPPSMPTEEMHEVIQILVWLGEMIDEVWEDNKKRNPRGYLRVDRCDIDFPQMKRFLDTYADPRYRASLNAWNHMIRLFGVRVGTLLPYLCWLVYAGLPRWRKMRAGDQEKQTAVALEFLRYCIHGNVEGTLDWCAKQNETPNHNLHFCPHNAPKEYLDRLPVTWVWLVSDAVYYVLFTGVVFGGSRALLCGGLMGRPGAKND